MGGNLTFTISWEVAVIRDSTALKVDSLGTLPLRTFKDPLTGKYAGDEFDYSGKDGDAQNLIAQFLTWFFEFLQDTFGIELPPGTTEFLEYLIYVLMAMLIVYLIIKFFAGENLAAVFTGRSGGQQPIYLQEEQLAALDLDELITAAIGQNDYRLAIRYQYMLALKVLSGQGIIEWHYDKTNRDYQREIRLPALQAAFYEISYLYDHIWYGEKPIDQVRYRAAVQKFETLKNKIIQF